MTTLAERLGYGPDEKLLIVNCDDLGSSASANRAIADVVDRGLATSATLMVPCPWALDGAARARNGGIGVHLTLTCEYPAYRWRSLTNAASLHDETGYMPATIQAVWDNADLADVRAECRAQIEQAHAWGVDVTHLDAHMGTMQLDPRYSAIFLELAAEHRLPVRMFGTRVEETFGFAARQPASDAGVVYPDHTIDIWARSRGAFAERMARLKPGVTEVFFHPVEDGPELRGYDLREPDIRVGDYAEMLSPGYREAIEAAGARLISFAPLRDLMRAA
ncbi:MAG: polysaccharide deacetylase family protein [Phenylobacterium sp.]|uniref:polysaccharide deacetylase family protein n=1 Tax=Phenylobacterium sp. TaxID=1871053 RepID=UPI001A52796E|nr:polysaccharide deacetylase family protein [Phenylobacterium sp.]MBL8555708.1 polysaccharide deacetylase family protein [Phenylobacterium sp.]